MKKFLASRVGQAVVSAINTAVILAICTPVFDLLFDGSIKEWNAYRYVIEPIIVGALVGLFGYFFQTAKERKNHK